LNVLDISFFFIRFFKLDKVSVKRAYFFIAKDTSTSTAVYFPFTLYIVEPTQCIVNLAFLHSSPSSALYSTSSSSTVSPYRSTLYFPVSSGSISDFYLQSCSSFIVSSSNTLSIVLFLSSTYTFTVCSSSSSSGSKGTSKVTV